MGRKKIYTDEFKQAVIDDVKEVAEKLGHKGLFAKDYYANGKYNRKNIIEVFGSWKTVLIKAQLKKTKITKRDIITDIRKVADVLKTKTLTMPSYVSKGEYHFWEVKKLFGGWEHAITNAGLQVRKMSDEDLLNDMKKVANIIKSKKLSSKTYSKFGKYSQSTIVKRFGSFADARMKAGLFRNITIPANDLLADIKRVAKVLKQNTVSMPQYDKLGKYSSAVYCNAYGSWKKANIAAGLKPFASMSEKELLEDMVRVAKLISPNKLTSNTYKPLGKYNPESMSYHIGNWQHALMKCGIIKKKVIKTHKGQIPTHLLIKDLQDVSQKSGEKYISISYYNKHGKYGASTFFKLGGWTAVLKKAGLNNKLRNKSKQLPDGRE